MEASQFSKRGVRARGLEGGAEAAAEAPRPCHVCRGTGKLLSNADGTPHFVTCPWCEGTKTLTPGHDAQEHPAETPREKTPEEVAAAQERAKAMLSKRGGRKATGGAKAAGAKKAPAKRTAAKKTAAKKAAPAANAPIPKPRTARSARRDEG
ncbi:hypothetical protein ACVU7I_03590 [Patulibacter sp. S7RM1-6]